MIFNKSRKYDFPPEFSFSNGEFLEVLEETRLLGIVLTSDLRWFANSSSIYSKAMGKMWLLRRMKILKLEPEIIVDYYIKEIRCLAEQGVAIWNSGLTKGQINDLEKIQKVALKIILGDEYWSYDQACEKFEVKSLSLRRLDLCTNFALKLYKSERSREYFTLPNNLEATRSVPQPVLETMCNTVRCYNAPHNYLGRLVNENKDRLQASSPKT